jgi:hypothetical protein
VRVLRLSLHGRCILDLHPAISIVTGLDEAQAATLRRAVAAVAVGLSPADGALLEAHGLLLDAPDDIDLLDLGADPQAGVVSRLGLRPPSEGDGEAIERWRVAERDVLVLAADRHRRLAALRSTETIDPEQPVLARADELRLALALHDATDVEPLRRALDHDRDLRRTGHDEPAAITALCDELAALGIDLRPHRPEPDEVRRVADDLLDEHLRQASWAIGARVELDGIERRMGVPPAPDGARPAADPALPESAQRRAERATALLADAVARADARRAEHAAAGELAQPSVRDLEWQLLELLTGRRRSHPAGSAPVLLDRLFAGLDDDEVQRILGRLEPLARSVQVLVLDDHPAAAAWAVTAGAGTAAVVRATTAPAGGASPTMRPSAT